MTAWSHPNSRVEDHRLELAQLRPAPNSHPVPRTPPQHGHFNKRAAKGTQVVCNFIRLWGDPHTNKQNSSSAVNKATSCTSISPDSTVKAKIRGKKNKNKKYIYTYINTGSVFQLTPDGTQKGARSDDTRNRPYQQVTPIGWSYLEKTTFPAPSVRSRNLCNSCIYRLSGKWRQHKSPQNSHRFSDKAPPESLCLAELSEPRSEELGHLQCRPPLPHLQHQPSAPAWHGPRSGQRHLPGGVSVRPTFEWWAGMMEQGWPTFNKARLKIEKVLGLNDVTWIRGKELMDMDLNEETT